MHAYEVHGDACMANRSKEPYIGGWVNKGRLKKVDDHN